MLNVLRAGILKVFDVAESISRNRQVRARTLEDRRQPHGEFEPRFERTLHAYHRARTEERVLLAASCRSVSGVLRQPRRWIRLLNPR